MKGRILVATLALIVAGVTGYLLYQDTLVPVPLAPGQALFVPARPEFGEDEAVIEALMPAGEKLEAFLATQSDLTLLETAPDGGARSADAPCATPRSQPVAVGDRATNSA